MTKLKRAALTRSRHNLPITKTEGLLRLEAFIAEHPDRYIVRKDKYDRLISAQDPESGMLYIVMYENGMLGLGFIS
mgnify:CR=1 FL=1